MLRKKNHALCPNSSSQNPKVPGARVRFRVRSYRSRPAPMDAGHVAGRCCICSACDRAGRGDGHLRAKGRALLA